MSNAGKHLYEFGRFRLDPANRLLLRDGVPLPETPKAVETLLGLIRHRRMAAAGIAVTVAAGCYVALFRNPQLPDRPAIESIAVLPFQPLSSPAVPELGSGLADAVITRLGNTRRVTVRSTSAILQYTASVLDLPAAGRALGVDAILDGKYQRNGARLRVSVQLIDLHAGGPAWAGKFEEPFTTTFVVQDAIARRVTDALASHLTSRTSDSKAHAAYLKGRESWESRTTPAVEDAIGYFERAVRYDPDYAPAWAGLADAYASLGSRSDTEEQRQVEAMPKTKAAALHALRLDDLLAEAHTALGVVKSRYDWDWPGAEAEFQRAIELDPNYAHAHQEYSVLLSAVGRADEAKAEMLRARELNPLSFPINRGLADILMRAHAYPQALEQFRLTLQINPDDPMTFALHRTMGWAYEMQGMHDQAAGEFLDALRLQGVESSQLATLRQSYHTGGMKGYWRSWLAFEQERIAHGHLSPFIVAQAYAFLGDQDTAFACLERAYKDRSLVVPALRYGPVFFGMRAGPRYGQLLRRIGLVP